MPPCNEPSLPSLSAIRIYPNSIDSAFCPSLVRFKVRQLSLDSYLKVLSEQAVNRAEVDQLSSDDPSCLPPDGHEDVLKIVAGLSHCRTQRHVLNSPMCSRISRWIPTMG
ncbi:MAG: hypothetical protein VYA30_07005 [Myxococcota bacterium]|nr:hypothetical protein [Myxococcota bacterium]